MPVNTKIFRNFCGIRYFCLKLPDACAVVRKTVITMKKLYILAFILMLTAGAASAQNNKWAIGVRGGVTTSGITFKYNRAPGSAIEGILTIPYDGGFTAIGLYEWRMPVITEGFTFYYGAGAHIGAWDGEFSLGADAIVGLEYKIPSVPLALSVDYKPAINLVQKLRGWFLDFGFGLKFTF